MLPRIQRPHPYSSSGIATSSLGLSSLAFIIPAFETCNSVCAALFLPLSTCVGAAYAPEFVYSIPLNVWSVYVPQLGSSLIQCCCELVCQVKIYMFSSRLIVCWCEIVQLYGMDI